MALRYVTVELLIKIPFHLHCIIPRYNLLGTTKNIQNVLPITDMSRMLPLSQNSPLLFLLEIEALRNLTELIIHVFK